DQLGFGAATIAGCSAVAAGAAVGFAAAHPESTRALILIEGGVGKSPELAKEAGVPVRSMPHDFPNCEAAIEYYGTLPDQMFTTEATVRDQAPYLFRRLPDGTVTWKHDPLLRERWPGDGDDVARNMGAHGGEVWQGVQCPILVVKGASVVLTVE